MDTEVLQDTWTIASGLLEKISPGLHWQAAETIADIAAHRWMDELGYTPGTEGDYRTLRRYLRDALSRYLTPYTRSDGSTIGPCIARDVELGHARFPDNLASDTVVDGRRRYDLWVYGDGSATIECSTEGGTYWLWTYPFAPDEPVTGHPDAPRHVLEWFEELRQRALKENAST